MRFLVDAQPPPALARWIEANGVDSRHALDLGLIDAADAEIWRLACEDGWTIVSKDEDFATRCQLSSGGPCVVWIRSGNLRKGALLERWALVWPSLVRSLRRGERLIEIV